MSEWCQDEARNPNGPGGASMTEAFAVGKEAGIDGCHDITEKKMLGL